MLKKAFDKSFAPFEGAMIAGVDEAGRGPLAGPVVTAAVILPQEHRNLLVWMIQRLYQRQNENGLAEKIKSVAIRLFSTYPICAYD